MAKGDGVDNLLDETVDTVENTVENKTDNEFIGRDRVQYGDVKILAVPPRRLADGMHYYVECNSRTGRENCGRKGWIHKDRLVAEEGCWCGRPNCPNLRTNGFRIGWTEICFLEDHTGTWEDRARVRCLLCRQSAIVTLGELQQSEHWCPCTVVPPEVAPLPSLEEMERTCQPATEENREREQGLAATVQPGDLFGSASRLEVTSEPVLFAGRYNVTVRCRCGNVVWRPVFALLAGMYDDCGKCPGKKSQKMLPLWGERKSLEEWAKDGRCAVSEATLRARLQDGYTLEDALAEDDHKPGPSGKVLRRQEDAIRVADVVRAIQESIKKG